MAECGKFEMMQVCTEWKSSTALIELLTFYVDRKTGSGLTSIKRNPFPAVLWWLFSRAITTRVTPGLLTFF